MKLVSKLKLDLKVQLTARHQISHDVDVEAVSNINAGIIHKATAQPNGECRRSTAGGRRAVDRHDIILRTGQPSPPAGRACLQLLAGSTAGRYTSCSFVSLGNIGARVRLTVV
eukprot:scaffold763_cov202-Alexandrium_tamarense.AAC.7